MKPTQKRLVYLTMIFLAGTISAYDNVLTLLLRDTLAQYEQNPLASWIIQQGGVPTLVFLKAIGTITACLVMIKLTYTRWRHAIIGVFVFQVLVFCYLSFYTVNGFDLFDEDAWTTIRMVLKFYNP